MIRLCVAENCVCRCSCPARNALSLSGYPNPHHFSPNLTPTFSLPALTTFNSSVLCSAVVLSQLRSAKARPIPIRAIKTDSDLLVRFSKKKKKAAQSNQIGVFKIYSQSMNRLDSLRSLGAFQLLSLVSMGLLFSWKRGPRAGRILVYQFIIRLIVSEIRI